MKQKDSLKIHGLIARSKSPFIVLSKESCEDEINGALALFLVLKKMGKKPRLVCDKRLAKRYFLQPEYQNLIYSKFVCGKVYEISFDTWNEPKIEKIVYKYENKTAKICVRTKGKLIKSETMRVRNKGYAHDLIVTISVSDPNRLGGVYSENRSLFENVPILNINQKPDAKYYGDANYVDTEAKTVTALIAGLIEEVAHGGRSGDVSNLIMAGIMTRGGLEANISDAGTNYLIEKLLAEGANKDLVSDYLKRRSEFAFILNNLCEKLGRYTTRQRGKDKRVRALYPKRISDKRKLLFAAAILAASGVYLVKSYDFKRNQFSWDNEKKSYVYIPVANLLFTSESLPISNKNVIYNGEVVDSQASNANSAPVKDKTGQAIEKNKSNMTAIKAIGVPKTLNIPKIKVNSIIETVGLNEKGQMEAPSNYSDTAWYEFGPKPGEKGNAVIAGHLDTPFDSNGVFWNLRKLKIGDYVYIWDEFGRKMRFKVIKVMKYNDKNVPMKEIFGSSDDRNLNLITCAGDWDEKNANYTERLVVFTRLDSEV